MRSLRRNPFGAVLFFSGLLALGSCRTSQQESRRANTGRNSVANGPAVSRQMDSLLLIEQKLTEVIDSMASLVDADHQRIRALEQEVQALQGQTNRASGVPLPPNQSSRANDSYMTSPPPSTPSQPQNSEPVAPSNPQSNSPSGNPSNTFQERYTAALALFNDNNFEAALDQFRSLEQDDPSGPYASNYRYWEGECYYGEKRYNKALETFGMVLEQYPNSTKVGASLFKSGECYEHLQDAESARGAYERVIADYPNSEFHSRALARLKALSK